MVSEHDLIRQLTLYACMLTISATGVGLVGQRDELLAAVRARVERAAATGDSSAVLAATARAEAHRLARCIDADSRDVQAAYALGRLHYLRAQALPPAVAQQDRGLAIRYFTRCFIAGMDGLPKPLLASLAEQAAPAAKAHLLRVSGSSDPAALTSAVTLWRRIAHSVPEGHAQHVGYLSLFATALHERYECTRDPKDLDEAIDASRTMVRGTLQDHRNHAGCLSNLGSLLQARSVHTEDPGDLDEAVEMSRAAVRAAPAGHADRAACLSNLGIALQERWRRRGDPADLDAGVEAHRAAVEATPQNHRHHSDFLENLGIALRQRFAHGGVTDAADDAVQVLHIAVRALPQDHGDRGILLAQLGTLLKARFERTDNLADLGDAIEVNRATLQATPEDHPRRAAWWDGLVYLLQMRFSRTGDQGDLDEAIEAGRAAVQAAPVGEPGRGGSLSNLAVVLRERFIRAGGLDDLYEAVERGRAAVEATPQEDPSRGSYLSNLGETLRERFVREGNLRDLDEAVRMSRAAVEATPEDHPHRSACLLNLGVTLREQYVRTGNLGVLDEAVERSRAAVHTAPPGHPGYASSLTSLNQALRNRFQRTGHLADLSEAIDRSRAAVQATPPQNPDYALYLGNLGNSLHGRFGRTRELRDLDEAIEVERAAVQAAPPGHPEHALCLNNLGNSLYARYGRTQEPGDLDEAIEVDRAAVQATPEGHPERALFLNNFGALLRARFARTGDRDDLDQAVSMGRAAVRATPQDHPSRAGYLLDLGTALRDQFRLDQEPADREEALSLWGQVVDAATASPSLRIRAARLAAPLAAAADPGRAADLLEQAVLLLPEVAPRRLQRSDQQHALSSIAAGLADSATAVALADTDGTAHDRAVRALRLTEAGRAVLLSQALDTRSDLTELAGRHPELARRFTELREILDQDPGAGRDTDGRHRAAGAGQERHRFATELEEVLRRIRACEGFTAFGLPPTTEDLLAEAAHGPVVSFNVSRLRSDALLLTRDGISSCPLPGLDLDTVARQVNTFYRALSEATAPDGDRIAAQQRLRQILEWLWDAAAEPTLSALASLGEVPPAEDGRPLPRVWWAPGGLLGLLPLHAAGFHTEAVSGAHRRTVMDRVVSSYTPTIRALRHARARRSRPADGSQSLIVAMPTTPGHSPLRYVPEEARRIRALLHCPIQLTEPAPAVDGTLLPPSLDTPTTATVLARLPQCAIAHFACHGAGDRTDPSQSRLLLHDHASTPLTVSALAHINLEHAQLAYLSACGTADPGGNARLLGEAIHLTSAFQLAGFPHVVGTLWPIDDRLAVEIAESFYTHLTAGSPGRPVPDRSATALHHTIRAVRDRFPATPSLWAAYLHAGA